VKLCSTVNWPAASTAQEEVYLRVKGIKPPDYKF